MNDEEICLPASENVPVEKLEKSLKSKSQSYKLFWMRALLKLFTKRMVSFDEIAWTVFLDAVEISKLQDLKWNANDLIGKAVGYIRGNFQDDELSLDCIKKDKNLNHFRAQLLLNVPFRIQSGFLPEGTGSDIWSSTVRVTETLNDAADVMYKFYKINNKWSICFQKSWQQYFTENYEIVDRFILSELQSFFERRTQC